MAKSGIMILKQGREKALNQRHPWVFSGAVDPMRTNLDDVSPGDIIDVRDFRGGFLGRGYYNPHSQIRVRILTWNQTDAFGPAWWRIRLAQAISRRGWVGEGTNAYRLVNAESDGLPGLIVDRYDDYLVAQFLTLGVEVAKEDIVKALVDLVKPTGVYERSDVDVRELDGLEQATGLLWGEEPPTPLVITEHGVKYPVDVYAGHKTGFYLDQKDSRQWLLTQSSATDYELLNCFSFSGAFSVCAALNHARHITNIDSSDAALDSARQAMALNNLADFPAEYISANVFDQLRQFREDDRTFDMIILDPPKFAHSGKQVKKAARGYKDINWLAFQLLRPGGILVTFSCSGHVSPDLFQKIVFGASVDAECDAQIIRWFSHPADHPVLLSFPEGRYLKGLVCRVV